MKRSLFTFCTKISSLYIVFCFVLFFHDFVLAKNDLPTPVAGVSITSVQDLSLDDKVGLLLMIGFPQDSLDEKLRAHIEKIHASSFLIFKRNIKNLKSIAELNQSLSNLTKNKFNIFPLIAVDQEGGAVVRVATSPTLPNAFSLGLTRDASLNYEYGLEVGKILRTYGFNMNLAPVLDITTSSTEDFIGLRSFGSSPELVSLLAAEYSRGLFDSKVLPTAKHFPGMSLISEDPHRNSIQSKRSYSEIINFDLLPYQKFFSLGNGSAIMLSHLIYPGLDSSNTPALFSKKISSDLLRKHLGFRGLVVTDDIQMRANMQNDSIVSVASTAENAIRALKAGSDLIILSWSFKDQERTFQAIKKAVLSGQISEQELNEKVHRKLQAKLQFKKAPSDTFLSSQTSVAQTSSDQPSLSPSSQNSQVHFSNRLAELERRRLQLFSFDLSNSLRSLFLPQALAKPSSLKGVESLCIYSQSRNFISSFQSKKLSNVRYFILSDGMSAKQLDAHSRSNNCQLNILTNLSRQNAALLDELVKLTKVNTSHSSNSNSSDNSKDSGYLESINHFAGSNKLTSSTTFVNPINRFYIINFLHPALAPKGWPHEKIIQASPSFINYGNVFADRFAQALSGTNEIPRVSNVSLEQGSGQLSRERSPAAENSNDHHPKTP